MNKGLQELKEGLKDFAFMLFAFTALMYVVANLFILLLTTVETKLCKPPKTHWTEVMPALNLGCYLNKEI